MPALLEIWEQEWRQTHSRDEAMSNELLNSPRPFQIWEYTVGHGQLLLRSPKAVNLPTRFDVLFKNVSAIHLPTTLDRLRISEANDEEKVSPHLGLDVATAQSRKIFVVRGSDFVGYVIAGVVVWHEDEGDYSDPSYFRLRPN